MRQIKVKYAGECRVCDATLEVGADAIYEKRVGLFCPSCAPTDLEEIRKFRQEGADRKADRYDGWASKREASAGAVLKRNEVFTGDHAFNTQPGHIPLRARVIAQNDRACESLNKARGMRAKASGLRHVRVKGDAEKARQVARDRIRPLLEKGMKVHTGIYGPGEIVRINKKTAKVGKTGASGDFEVNVDLSWIRILEQEDK